MCYAKSINELVPGETAVIMSVSAKEDMRRRLTDIGMTAGASVRCVGVSPLGDPRAYMIRGAVIALRGEDGKNIMIGGGSA